MKVKCKYCEGTDVERFGKQETDKMTLITYWCNNCKRAFYIKVFKTK